MTRKTKFTYSAEQLDFLREGYASMPVRDLAPAFNAAFGLDKTVGQIRSALKNHGITCGRPPGQANKGQNRLLTPEQHAFVVDQYPHLSRVELTEALNARFRLKLQLRQVIAYCKNHGIRSGRTGHFSKGQTSWNKGKKGYMGPNATSFADGHVPHNKRRLWSERISKDGYVEISVPERNPYTGHPTRFKHKHLWLWECENGPVPKGCAVVFKDGDSRNFEKDNLILVSRAELLSMNLHGYRQVPEELKGAVLALAKIEAKAGFRLCPARGRK
jgi:hypothetical protein